MTRCRKCDHLRPRDTLAPAWQCAACGVAYAKAEEASRSGELARASGLQATFANAPARPNFLATRTGKALLALVMIAMFAAAKAWLGSSRPASSVRGSPPAVEIYTTSYCDTCKVAKAYMKRRGIAYTEYDVGADVELRREFYARGGQGTPLIFVHGRRLQGFDAGEFERMRAQKPA